MIINLTQHRIDVFAPDAPDVIPGGSALRPTLTIEPSGTVARIAERLAGERHVKGIGSLLPSGVAFVEYSHVTGLPPVQQDVWCLVSLATALALPMRMDLLVPWRQVRNHLGVVVGCRSIARPVVATR
jgi:hypothetical protein